MTQEVEWFHRYVSNIDAAQPDQSKLGDKFLCPCCRFPTLSERAAWDICGLCWWEDDGQDDPNAEEVWGGPNKGYSLAKARENFADHLDMFDVGKGIEATEKPSRARLALLAYIGPVVAQTEAFGLQQFAALLEGN